MNTMKLTHALPALCLLGLAAPIVIGQQEPALPQLEITFPYTGNPDAVDSQSAAAKTIPLWKGTITSFNKSYTYRMVGTDPTTAQAHQSSTVPSTVIPIIFTFHDGSVFDPTTVDKHCSAAGSADSLTMASPIFQDFNYVVGGTSVGNTQYVDFFQRANFWHFTKPGGVNPNYHVLLNPVLGNAVHVTVPAAKGSTLTGSWCGKLGLIEINWWDNYLQQTLFPLLATKGVSPTQFPIFLFYNVVQYVNQVSNCCILGYHNAVDNPHFGNLVQTYSVNDFDTSGAFGAGARDIDVLSHEVAEWMDDPLTNNATPAWGHTGQVSGCQADLEVGDPLSGNFITVKMPNKYTYHPQELAFFSWFFRQAPSIGVNGWFSSNDTFKKSQPLCK
jgi:hypothetical protein